MFAVLYNNIVYFQRDTVLTMHQILTKVCGAT